MILLYILHFINVILIQSSKKKKNYIVNNCLFLMHIESYEIPTTDSNEFLKSKISFRSNYEESRETTETKREVNYFLIILFLI